MGVTTPPGLIQLILTPLGASSSATHLAKCRRAALEELYAAPVTARGRVAEIKEFFRQNVVMQ